MQSAVRVGARSYHEDIHRLHGPLTVRGVFPHAWSLCDPDGWVLTVSTAAYNGPLAVRVEPSSLGTLGVEPGTGATLGERALTVGPVEIGLDEAAIWSAAPPGPPRPLSLPALRNDVRRVTASQGAVAQRDDPWTKAGSRTMPEPLPTAGLLAALLGLDEPALQPEVRALLGLGPGLTPAGDDLLCGLSAGLVALGRRQGVGSDTTLRRARLVGAALAGATPGRTTALSRTMLHYAARLVAIEPLLDVLWSLGSGGTVCGLSALLSVGHSSGRHMLAGALLAARVVLEGGERDSALGCSA